LATATRARKALENGRKRTGRSLGKNREKASPLRVLIGAPLRSVNISQWSPCSRARGQNRVSQPVATALEVTLVKISLQRHEVDVDGRCRVFLGHGLGHAGPLEADHHFLATGRLACDDDIKFV
jgi:hypothetical protein